MHDTSTKYSENNLAAHPRLWKRGSSHGTDFGIFIPTDTHNFMEHLQRMSVTNHGKPLSLPAEHRQPPYLVTLPENQTAPKEMKTFQQEEQGWGTKCLCQNSHLELLGTCSSTFKPWELGSRLMKSEQGLLQNREGFRSWPKACSERAGVELEEKGTHPQDGSPEPWNCGIPEGTHRSQSHPENGTNRAALLGAFRGF